MSTQQDIRVVFSKRRDTGIVAGRTLPQLAFLLAAGTCVVFFVRSLGGAGEVSWWLLPVALVLLLVAFARVMGRGVADVGPSLAVNTILAGLHLREYRGGPHRTRPADNEAIVKEQPRLPGTLKSLEIVGFRFSVSGEEGLGEVGAVFDRADGSVTVVLKVESAGFPLMDSAEANGNVLGFQRMLDGIASQADSPITGIQFLNRIIPDLGEEATREWHRRGGMGSGFSRHANEQLLASQVGRGIRHESYIAIRTDPARARASVREFGGGDEGKAALAFRAASRIKMELAAAGIGRAGWVPPRGIAAVIRSAFDPSSDQTVARRGGGTGDAAGGDTGLPSGVSPAATEPMYLLPTRKILVHNDSYSRAWWIEEFPRARSGVPVGFLQPLLLEVGCRHTVTILLQPLDRRTADRRITQVVSTQDAKRSMNAKLRRRTTRADQREEADLDRTEIDAVEGFATYRLAMVVTATASSARELETVSAEMEAAMNNCSMEAKTWYVETDQAFYMGALPLARGLA